MLAPFFAQADRAPLGFCRRPVFLKSLKLMNTRISQTDNQASAKGVPLVLTIGEVAELLRCSKAHVQNLLAGKVSGAAVLPFMPLGRRKLIRRESLLLWMERAEGAKQC